jgi:hypothetical protein
MAPNAWDTTLNLLIINVCSLSIINKLRSPSSTSFACLAITNSFTCSRLTNKPPSIKHHQQASLNSAPLRSPASSTSSAHQASSALFTKHHQQASLTQASSTSFFHQHHHEAAHENAQPCHRQLSGIR